MKLCLNFEYFILVKVQQKSADLFSLLYVAFVICFALSSPFFW